jgi:1-deoxyxylulose-5-phosphate synthase
MPESYNLGMSPKVVTPRRSLGRTNFPVTPLGIGDLADRRVALDTLVATARRALDAGLNLIDTAPSYEDGYSEQLVGQAIASYPREQIFLISKIDQLESNVTPQIEASLKRLNQSHTDLFVFHGLSDPAILDRLTHPGAGFSQLDACIKSGKTRFKGISSHHPDVLRRAIELDLCDVVMFPLGPYVDDRYVRDILPLAKSKNVGIVSFKTYGAGKLLADTTGYNQPLQDRPRGKISSGGLRFENVPTLPHLSVEDCLHYTLTLDPDCCLLGLSFPNEQDASLAAYRSFQPLPGSRMTDIHTRAKEAIKEKGKVWWNPSGT